MELLTTRGSEEIDDWSVSLEQDAIGTQETVKETRLELKRRFALAANVRLPVLLNVERGVGGKEILGRRCSFNRASKHLLKKYLARPRLAVLASAAKSVGPLTPNSTSRLSARDIANQRLVCTTKLRM
jgi:hypothetical protein